MSACASAGALREAQRRAMELETNEQRKALTEYERSKDMVRRAQEVIPLLVARRATMLPPKASDGVLGGSPKTPPGPGGRPPKGDVPEEDIADALGVSRRELRRREQHVAAVAEHPDLAPLPLATALREVAVHRAAAAPWMSLPP